MQAGFRESGALNLLPSGKDAATTPMVAIRTMGLAFESLVGRQVDGRRRRLVSPEYLRTVVRIANERFVENAKRIERFRAAFRDAVEGASAPRRNPEGGEWEDAAARRERKRAEGLRRKAEKQAQRVAGVDGRDFDTTAETEFQTGSLLGL